MVGAGGHAQGVREAAELCGHEVVAVADPKQVDWDGVTHISGDQGTLPEAVEGFILGLGAVEPKQLEQRFSLYQVYRKRKLAAPAIIHPTAFVSPRAKISDGVIVLANAVIQPAATLLDASIVNTGSVVEHDAIVGAGAHIAPAACVLGGVMVGSVAMVGAGSVILPGAIIGETELVPALTRFPIGSQRRTGYEI